MPALAVLALAQDAGAGLTATVDPDLVSHLDNAVFVDTRDGDICASASIDGALCIAPTELLHPDGSPASFRGINWLAGTFGLDPAATAVVFGDDRTDGEFVAGMLFLLGQYRIVIWQGDLRSMLEAMEQGPGRRRSILRSLYYASPVRDEHIALDDDGGGLLVLAGGTREAVAGFARLLLEHPSVPAQVHVDGLGGRAAESLGAPREGYARTMSVAVSLGVALVLWAVLARRRRAVARPR